jgi:hypothetical protein
VVLQGRVQVVQQWVQAQVAVHQQQRQRQRQRQRALRSTAAAAAARNTAPLFLAAAVQVL